MASEDDEGERLVIDMERGEEEDTGGPWSVRTNKGRKRSAGGSNDGSEGGGTKGKKLPRASNEEQTEARSGSNEEQAEASMGEMDEMQENEPTNARQGRTGATSRQAIYDNHLVVYATGKDTNIARTNPIKMERAITNAAGAGVRVSKARESLRIACEDREQKWRLMATGTLDGHEVTYSEPFSLTRRGPMRQADRQIVKGIIFGVPLETTEDEITQYSGAISARRIRKWIKGQEIITAQVVLEYYEELPERVEIGWLACRVKEFIPDPLRCRKCQAYGHRCQSDASKADSSNSKWAEVSNSKYSQNSNCGALRRKTERWWNDGTRTANCNCFIFIYSTCNDNSEHVMN